MDIEALDYRLKYTKPFGRYYGKMSSKHGITHDMKTLLENTKAPMKMGANRDIRLSISKKHSVSYSSYSYMHYRMPTIKSLT